jgi:hypothetical protein
MPILYNVGNKLTAGSEPPQLYRYQDRVLGDGGTLETRDEASTFIRRLRSAGVLGSTVIAGVAGGYKAGKLYSIIGPDLDVTRGTVKNRVNRAGVLSEVASGVPATDFAGGVLRGTTVEPSAVNLFFHSEAFNEGYWTKTNATLTQNVAIAPDGAMTADLLETSTTFGRIVRTFDFLTLPNNQPVTISIFVKSGTTNSFRIIGRDKNNNALGANFNVDTLSTNTVTAGVTPLIEVHKDDWIRCSITYSVGTGSTASSECRLVQILAPNSTEVTAGSAGDNLFIWGAQLETGSVATSYIKTEGSAQTRNADVITKTGLGSVLPQTEGWVYAEVDVTRFIAGATRPILYFDDGTARRGILLTNLNRLAFRNAEFQITETGKYKVLARHTSGFASFDLFVNGILRTSNSLTATGVNTSIGLGVRQVDNDQFFNDPIHSYAIGSGSITDAQAIQLTTL